MHSHPIRAAVFDIDGTLAMIDKDNGTYQALPLRRRRWPTLVPVAWRWWPIPTAPSFRPPTITRCRPAPCPGDILPPAAAAARHLAAKGYRRILVLGADGTRVPLGEAEIAVALPGQAGSVDAVLIGWTRDFGAADLKAAAQAVRAGVPLFATSVAPYFASAKGRMLGISGAIAAGIQNATGVTARVFGKPEVAGLAMAAELAGVPPAEMVAIGDDPMLEIMMAHRAGSFAVGVTTGLADHTAFHAIDPALRADVVLASLTGLADHPWWR